MLDRRDVLFASISAMAPALAVPAFAQTTSLPQLKGEGKKRSAEIPNILHMSVDPLPTMHPIGEMWANTGYPINPDKLAFAVRAPGSTFNDQGMRWDNSGKKGHYSPIRWSNQ